MSVEPHDRIDASKTTHAAADQSKWRNPGAEVDEKLDEIADRRLTTPGSWTDERVLRADLDDGIQDSGIWLTDNDDLLNVNLTSTIDLTVTGDVNMAIAQMVSDIDMNGNDIVNPGEFDGVDVAALATIRNGSFNETFDATVDSDGATVTMSLEQSGGGDLTMWFSDGDTVLDCTPAATIALTAGTDDVPVTNHIYVLQSTKALTNSTTGWPSAEHIRVGYFFVRSAGTVQTNSGSLINQNWNDHLAGTDGMGHLLHIAERVRVGGATLGAVWFSGVDGAGVDDWITVTGGSPDTVDFKSTTGVVYQMHRQTYAAKDTSTGTEIIVVNDSVTAYNAITDIADALTDASGGSMSGKYFNLHFFGVANKGGQYGPVLMNLPTGSYNSSSDATNDVSGFDVATMPREFDLDSSVGFPICRVTFRHQPVGGGTWTVIETRDLRKGGGAGGGGVAGNQTDFSDGDFTWFNSTDPTKIVDVDASGLTTATTRTITIPDEDCTLPTAADLTKLDGIEASADVTDATNVDAAGAVMESDVDAKGDIFAATADNTVTRLAVGTNDQVLTADSAEASGVKWADASGGGGGGGTGGGQITFFQVEDDGTTGQLTTGTAADLAGMWGTPSQTDATDFSWNGTTGILTVNTTGKIEFNVKVTSWNNLNNRHELHAQIYKNGSAVIIEDSQYSSRNNTQDEGSAYIVGFIDDATATDTYRIRVFDVGVAATIGAAAVANETYLSAKLYTGSGGSCIWSDAIETDSTLVSNTTSETDFDQTITIPADIIAQGRVLHVEAGGFCRTNTFSTCIYTYKLKLGSTTIHANSTVSVNNVASTGWQSSWAGTCRTGGATGDIDTKKKGATAHTTLGTAQLATLTSSIDWTATQEIKISVQMNVANANNQSQLEHLSARVYA